MSDLKVFLPEMLASSPFDLPDDIRGSPPERLVNGNDNPVGVVVYAPRQDLPAKAGIGD